MTTVISSPDYSQWHLTSQGDHVRAQLVSAYEDCTSNNPVLNWCLVRTEGAPFAERLLGCGGLPALERSFAVAVLNGPSDADSSGLLDFLAPWSNVSPHGTQFSWIRQAPVSELLSYWTRAEFLEQPHFKDFVSEHWFERSRLNGHQMSFLCAQLCSRVSDLPRSPIGWQVAQTWAKMLAVSGEEDDFESATRFAHTAYDCGALGSSDLIRIGRIRRAQSFKHENWCDFLRRGAQDQKRLLFEDGGHALCRTAVRTTDVEILWTALKLPLSLPAIEAILLCAHALNEDEVVRRLGTSRLIGYVLPRLSDAALQTLVDMEEAGLTYYNNGLIGAYANRRRHAPAVFQPPAYAPQYGDHDARRWDPLTSICL